MDAATAYLILSATIFVLGTFLLLGSAVLVRTAKTAADTAARSMVPGSKIIELEGNLASLQSEFTRFQRREDQRARRDNKELDRVGPDAGTPGGPHIPGVMSGIKDKNLHLFE